ncbi:hypothetical protein AB0M95_36685 [Sphaerisporangium sp. NPDC051017]|uniref:hypothetical protein n=1 Tax=Sphaerisporangium sp. NPDC051017 TaxID=3154636 RepID=UPI00344AF65F
MTPTPATTGWYGSSITSLAWNDTEVWAGGSGQDDATARSVGLLLRWNGTAWQQAPKPPLLDDYRIKQLGAVPGGGLWATGYGTRETDERIGPIPVRKAALGRRVRLPGSFVAVCLESMTVYQDEASNGHGVPVPAS